MEHTLHLIEAAAGVAILMLALSVGFSSTSIIKEQAAIISESMEAPSMYSKDKEPENITVLNKAEVQALFLGELEFDIDIDLASGGAWSTVSFTKTAYNFETADISSYVFANRYSKAYLVDEHGAITKIIYRRVG